MGKEAKQLRVYEEVLVLHPDAVASEQKQVFTTSSKVIKEHGGRVHRLDTWGSRPLANPNAKRVQRGLYFHMIFEADPQTISELKRRLRINDKVVYFHHERIPAKKSVENYIKEFLDGFQETQRKAVERATKLQKKARV